MEYRGHPTGVAEVADNARVITENRFLMADIGDETEQCTMGLDGMFFEVRCVNT